MKRQPGFSLIELMIVVVVIAVLASVAYPSYQNSVRRGHRSNAQSFMMDAAAREQQVFLDSRGYAAAANNTAFQGALGLAVPDDVAQYYDLKVEPDAGPPPGFTITAEPKAGSMQFKDGALTLDSEGNKTPADKW